MKRNSLRVAVLPGQGNAIGQTSSRDFAGNPGMELLAIKPSSPRRYPVMRAFLQVNAIPVVTGESLIPSIAGKCDRDVLPGQLANEISRQHGRVTERLFQRAG